MTTSSPAVIASVAGFGASLWLGLYLLVRGPRSALIRVALAGLFTQALFFLAAALTDTAADPARLAALERASWWTTVAPLALWYHYTRLAAARVAGRPLGRAPVAVAYLAAGLVAAVGTATDLFVRYDEIGAAPPGGSLVLRPGPAYGLYVALQALAGAGVLANVAVALRAGRRDHRLRPLLLLLGASSLLFLGGALWLSLGWGWQLPLAPLPGSVLLLLGLAALGYAGVASGMLLEGQHVRRDFLYSFTGLALINLLYAAPLALAGVTTAPALLLLVGLVTLTHTTLDETRTLLDRLFFSPAERDARAEARGYAALLSTTPVGLAAGELAATYGAPGAAVKPGDPPEAPEVQEGGAAPRRAFEADVRRALTGLKSPPRLAQSPLLGLRQVTQRLERAGLADNRLNRAAALREILVEAIEGLRPEGGDEGAHRVGEAWRFYNVLHYPYVRELSRKGALAEARRLELARQREGRRTPGELEQVLRWLTDVDEDTYYKWQRRASDTIALILWESERGAAGGEGSA